jgi:ribonuclease HI
MSNPPLLRIYTDGAARGNPGPAAYAYVIQRDGQDDVEEADRLGRMTNNQAEYTALVEALKHALELSPEAQVVVHSDSELMVKQMRGEYRVKNEELKPLYEEAKALTGRFAGGVRLVHVPRAENSRADALGNEALDGKRQATPRASTVAALGKRPPSAKTAAPVASAAPPLREQALTYLRNAAAAWRSGVEEPTPEDVWRRIAELLIHHGVKLPPSTR